MYYSVHMFLKYCSDSVPGTSSPIFNKLALINVKENLPALLVPLTSQAFSHAPAILLSFCALPSKLLGGDLQSGCPKAKGDLELCPT